MDGRILIIHLTERLRELNNQAENCVYDHEWNSIQGRIDEIEQLITHVNQIIDNGPDYPESCV